MVGIFEEASELNFFEITANEKHVVGSLAYNGEFASTIAFLNDGRIDARPLITGKIKLADIVSKGFEELVNHKEQNIKIIVSRTDRSDVRGHAPADAQASAGASSGRLIVKDGHHAGYVEKPSRCKELCLKSLSRSDCSRVRLC